MLGWQLKLGQSEEIGVPNYDKDVSHNHNPVAKFEMNIYDIHAIMKSSLPVSMVAKHLKRSLPVLYFNV